MVIEFSELPMLGWYLFRAEQNIVGVDNRLACIN